MAEQTPPGDHIKQGKALLSRVKQLRGHVGSDPSKAEALADALNELTANRLVARQFADATADAQEAVVAAAKLLGEAGPVGAYTPPPLAARYYTAVTHVAVAQAGLGQPDAAAATMGTLDDFRARLVHPLASALHPRTAVWALATQARGCLASGDVAGANAFADAALTRVERSGLRSSDDDQPVVIEAEVVVSDARWAAGHADESLQHLRTASDAHEAWAGGRLGEAPRLSPALLAFYVDPLVIVRRRLAERLASVGDVEAAAAVHAELVERLAPIAGRLGPEGKTLLAELRASGDATAGPVPEYLAGWTPVTGDAALAPEVEAFLEPEPAPAPDLEAVAAERAAARAEADRIEAERQAAARAEAERVAAERAERERLAAREAERQRVEREQLEQERLEQEQLEQERLEHERLEKERMMAEEAERQRLEAERFEAVEPEQPHVDYERAESEALWAAQAEQEREPGAKSSDEKLLAAPEIERDAEQREREAAEEAERERIEADRVRAEEAARQPAVSETLAEEELQRERASQEYAAEQERLRLEAEGEPTPDAAPAPTGWEPTEPVLAVPGPTEAAFAVPVPTEPVPTEPVPTGPEAAEYERAQFEVAAAEQHEAHPADKPTDDPVLDRYRAAQAEYARVRSQGGRRAARDAAGEVVDALRPLLARDRDAWVQTMIASLNDLAMSRRAMADLWGARAASKEARDLEGR
ncbi:MAG TPA: hypothetical protein VFN73_09555 [Propionibacteriaceae bacterium]|nr:hypothetical protein [Propionibacteriaceae bacterium]